LSESENEKVVKKLIKASNRQSPSDMVTFLADDVQAVMQDYRKENKEEIENSYNWFFSVFPDAHMSVDLLMSQDETVVVEFTFTCTHKGEIAGIQPTNKEVVWAGVWIFDFKDGKIISWREYFNPEPIYQQLRE
jgi:steroid delta-isomerase-like uncharacterized protein